MNPDLLDEPMTPGPKGEQAGPHSAWWPYVLPMAVFLALTTLEGYLPRLDGQTHPTWYPLVYALKVVIVLATMGLGWRVFRDLWPLPNRAGWALAVGTGLLVAVGWVGLEQIPYPKIAAAGTRQAFDPFVLGGWKCVAFLCVRLFGMVLMVPVMEELFWRSFLIRWLIDPDFGRVPMGRVTLQAAVITSGLFALAHPEWLPALLTGLAWAGLLARTKSLSACVVSHAVANLALAVYVLATRDWRFW